MLAERMPDGATRRDHLIRASESLGRVDPELQETLPPGGEGIWDAFCELLGSRQMGMGAPGGIAQSEIAAWQSNTGIRLRPWEVETICRMDAAARAAAASGRQQQAPATKRGH